MSYTYFNAHAHDYMWVKQLQKLLFHLNNHRSTILTKKTELPISKHFKEMGHKISDLKFSIIDHVPPLKKGGDFKTNTVNMD